MDALEAIAAAVLYEGYVLWPYRRSARKNQQRWTFGGVYPQGFVEATRAGDAWRVRTQCLLVADPPPPDAPKAHAPQVGAPHVEVELRFLQVVDRRVARTGAAGQLEFVDELHVGDERILAWDEAVERRIACTTRTVSVPAGEEHESVDGGVIVRTWQSLEGAVDLRHEQLLPGVWRLTASLANTSSWSGTDRTAAQRRSFLSAHFVLRSPNGAFVSMTDPPSDLADAVAACENTGLWPVLVGTEPERSTMLASPIILYDYPRVAPESPGDFFDSSEIDQMLILNTLTLTDEEKAEVRATDPKARAILDRAESFTAQDLAKLHGTIRDFQVLRSPALPESLSPPQAMDWPTNEDDFGLLQMERPTPSSVHIQGTEVRPGTTVLLRPRQGADIFDMALAGRIATVQSIEQDYEERVHLAVTLKDDPGSDLGAERMPGHRFFFSPDEVEPLST